MEGASEVATMVQRVAHKTSRIRFGPALYLAILLTIVGITAVACGVKSGERAPARPAGQIEEFHRSPVTALEQFRIDLTKTDEGCTADPADVAVSTGQRVRLAIQLPTEIVQGTTRSLEVVGERIQVNYAIPGLEITGSGGSFAPGVKEFNIIIESGAKNNYDFNPVTVGQFPIMCDGLQVGTFTLSEG